MTRSNTTNKYYNRGPKVWTFEGSNDNDNWTVLDSRSGITWSAYNANTNPYKEYSFYNDSSYRYYRITLASSNDGSLLELNRLEYFSSPELRVTVAEGDSVTNATVAIAGFVRVVKDGEGEFADAKSGQSYTGGTAIAEGMYALAGTASLDWPRFTLGTGPAKPVSLRVGENATLANIPSQFGIGDVLNGTSTVYKAGGDWTIPGGMYLGWGTSANTRGDNTACEFNHEGGETSIAGVLAVPRWGSGVFNMNGGTVTVGSEVRFGSGHIHNHSYLNLNGGEFATSYLYYFNGEDEATATVRFNGGTLKITEAGAMARGYSISGHTDYSDVANLQNVLLFKVAAGGGTIDTASNDVTMPLAISEDPESTGGGMKFKGGGTMTLDAAPSYAGGTVIEAGTALKLSAAAKEALTAYPVAVEVPPFGAIDGTVVLEAFDSTFTAEELAVITITGAEAGRYALALVDEDTKIVVVDTYAGEYVWNGGSTGLSWKTPGNWTKNGSPGNWYDSTRAVFESDGDAAAVDTAVTAASVTFRADAAVYGPAALTATAVAVLDGVSAVIAAPTAGSLEKTGPGKLTLSENRTMAATTLSEGTLALAGTATLDWTKFTFGTDSVKPVTLEVGEGATLANIPASGNGWELGNAEGITSSVRKTGGDWSVPGKFTLGAPGALACVYHEGGTMTTASRFAIGENGPGYFEISGGTVRTTGGATTTRPLVGVNAEGTMVVRGGGKLIVENNNLFVGVNPESAGVLTVDDGGEVAVDKDLVYNINDANSSGVVNLKSGGVMSIQRMYSQKGGSATFNFDGGTLFATGNGVSRSIFSGDDGSNAVIVRVKENGGTIDTRGNSVSVAVALLEDEDSAGGGMAFKGGGSVTLASGNTYTGVTAVEVGTTVYVAAPEEMAGGLAVTVNEDEPPAGGVYTLVAISGDGEFDDAILDGVADPDGGKVMLSESGKSIVCAYGDEQGFVWIGGDSGSLAEASNWANAQVPGDGDSCVIGCDVEAFLETGDGFAPSFITFPAGSAPVTIAGDAIYGVIAITNLSSSSHTIDAPVYFTGDIQVVQEAVGGESDLAKPHITFAGGAYGFSLDGANVDPVYSRLVFGEYFLANGEESPWTVAGSTTGNGHRRNCLAEDSVLHVPYAGDIGTIYIGTNARLVIGNQTTADRLSYCILGEYIVTNEFTATFPASAIHYCGYDNISSGLFKFEKMTLDGNNNSPFKFGNANPNTTDAGTQRFYIGRGGLCFADGASQNLRYETGGAKNTATVRIDPWHGDYTIHTKAAENPTDFTVSTTTYFGTTDENGDASTVTADGVINSYGSAAKIHFDGKGTFVVNAVNAATCPVTVHGEEGTTLAINPGKKLTTGTTAVDSGATIKVAKSGTVALGGDLTLGSGAKLAFNYTTRDDPVLDLSGRNVAFGGGDATNVVVKVSVGEGSSRPAGGRHKLTCGGKFQGVAVSHDGALPNGVKGLGVDALGDIYIDVVQSSMVVIK